MGTRLRVLLVEDSEADANLIMRELQYSGYDLEFERVHAPETFSAALIKQPWDVVIADYFMPRFNGLDALAMVRESSLDLPFIIVSGVIGEDVAVAAMKGGAYDYVMKDHLARLGPAVRRALQEAGERLARKQAEAAQRQSERTAHAILNASADSIFLLDPDGVFLAANRIGARRFDKEVDEIIGLCSYDLMQPDMAASRKAYHDEAVRTGKPTRYEDERRGTYFDTTVHPILDEQGKVTHLAIFARDITERKRMEEVLRQRNRELALINQVSQAFSSTLDPDQVLTVAMEEVCSILSAIAASIWLVDPKTDELVCRQAIGPKSVEVRGWRLPPGEGIAGFVARHGQSLIVPDTRVDEHHYKEVDRQTGLDLRSIISTPLKVEQSVIGVLQVVDTGVDRFSERDLALLEPLAASAAIAFENARLYEHARQEITERKRAEEELRESEHRYRTLFDSASDAIFIHDLTGRFLEVNRVACERLGYSREELLRMTPMDIDSPEYAALVSERIEELRRRRGRVLFEAAHVRRDGTIIPVELSSRIVEYAGSPAVLSIARDITERRQAEEALRQYAVELEARNEELNAFAHTVAHDLKTPLGLVLGYAEMLEQDHAKMSGKALLNHLQTMTRTALRMNNIIHELLLLSELRQVEVEMRPIDMANVVAEAQQRLTSMIGEYQAEIILPETWPVALGYGPWIEEVWANYLSNAIKYGGQPPCVEVGATVQPDGAVRFWVHDNGPGLTPEEQAHLFTPFTRLDQVRARGHGLGLSIVRRIVEKLGGQVGVESEVGQGSVFAFTLPGGNR